MNSSRLVLLFLLLAMAAPGHADAKFGRFFTTPAQRHELDQLRMKQDQKKVADRLPKNEPAKRVKPVEKAPPNEAVVLKGVVYRKGGKSTAWVNDGNSYEADMDSQYTGVNVDKIRPDQVTIDYAGTGARIKLRVGQSYLPATNTIRDVIDSQNAK
jgi:hypothetical protein